MMNAIEEYSAQTQNHIILNDFNPKQNLMNRKNDENRFVTTAENLTRGVTVIAVTTIEPKSKQQQLEILHPIVVSLAL